MEEQAQDEDLTLADAWSVLAQSGWLASCDPDTREALRGIARFRAFHAGEYLYHAGDEANGVFGIVSGSVDSLIPLQDGEEFVANRAGGGFWIGDLAVFADQPRLVSLRAATALRVVYLPGAQLLALSRQQPTILADFFRLTGENFTTTFAVLSNLAVPGATNRVALRLLMQGRALPRDDGWIHIDQESLAEMVALSQQSVRRSIRELQSRGLIESGYGRIRILDHAGLAGLCGYDVPRKRAG